jgi:predicted Fe-S protein YdhL (DUF1289 family)
MAIEIENWEWYTNQEKSQIIRRIEDLRNEDPKDYPKYS